MRLAFDVVPFGVGADVLVKERVRYGDGVRASRLNYSLGNARLSHPAWKLTAEHVGIGPISFDPCEKLRLERAWRSPGSVKAAKQRLWPGP